MAEQDNRPMTYGEKEPPLGDAQKRALEAGATDPATRGEPIMATDQAAIDQRNADRERDAHEHRARQRAAAAGQAGTEGGEATTTTSVNPAGPGSPNAAPHAGPHGSPQNPVNADGTPTNPEPGK